MLPPIAERQQNLLIAALPGADVERLAPHLERVSLPLGEMLYEPGQQLQHAYFPTSAIVSLHCLTHAGASAESAGVGNDGVVGISLFMGGDTTPGQAVVRKESQRLLADLRAPLFAHCEYAVVCAAPAVKICLASLVAKDQ